MALTGVIARYADAWNDHDAATCAACFLPQGRRIWCVRWGAAPDPRQPPCSDGREAIAASIAGLMASVADLRLEVSALSEGSDQRIWTEWSLLGTCVADPGAPGEPVDVMGVSIFRIDPGGIREERVSSSPVGAVGSPAPSMPS